MKGIADTGFLVAFANRRDAHHEWAVVNAAELTEPLLTCEAVLVETAHHLQNIALVLEMIELGMITLAFEAERHLEDLQKLAKRYEDWKPDFADLCLVRMSELFLNHTILTVDGDFRFYRRNRRQMIPVSLPPEKRV